MIDKYVTTMSLTMKLTMLVFPCLLILSSCRGSPTYHSSEIALVQALSDHHVTVHSYEISESIFRGVLWPSATNKNFKLWLIKAGKEYYVTIPAPPEVSEWQKDVTDDWKIEHMLTAHGRRTYTAVMGVPKLAYCGR